MTPLTQSSSTELKFTAWRLPLIRPAAKKQRAVPTASSQKHTHPKVHVNVISPEPATKIGCHFNQLGVKGQRGQIPDLTVRVMGCGQYHNLHPDPHKQSHSLALKPHTIHSIFFPPKPQTSSNKHRLADTPPSKSESTHTHTHAYTHHKVACSKI